jgi:hypothetical protein
VTLPSLPSLLIPRIYTRKRLSDLAERVERVGFYNREEGNR